MRVGDVVVPKCGDPENEVGYTGRVVAIIPSPGATYPPQIEVRFPDDHSDWWREDELTPAKATMKITMADQRWEKIESQLPAEERGECGECHAEPLPATYYLLVNGAATICPNCYRRLERDGGL